MMNRSMPWKSFFAMDLQWFRCRFCVFTVSHFWLWSLFCCGKRMGFLLFIILVLKALPVGTTAENRKQGNNWPLSGLLKNSAKVWFSYIHKFIFNLKEWEEIQKVSFRKWMVKPMHRTLIFWKISNKYRNIFTDLRRAGSQETAAWLPALLLVVYKLLVFGQNFKTDEMDFVSTKNILVQMDETT